MPSNIKKIELVAPAGGWEQFIAALNSGADSVYLGYRQFGARAYADNFSFKQLVKAVAIAHKRNAKVYLTLNTILKDDEIPEIVHFLNKYLSICRDGIIIQDFGLYKMVSDLYRELVPIHASTQMNVHNNKSLSLLKELGFKRVVLAREMTLDEIKKIKENIEIDLEVFGHGSQCYSYSGNCYFSSFVGGRSGNRGRCSQPCRMKFMLAYKDGGGFSYLIDSPAYLLSKSDLYTLNILPEIIRSGVKALKIEGRMKSPEYVAIVIRIYRKYIDQYYKDPQKYHVKEDDIYKLTQIFSRKLSSGYYNECFPQDIISAAKSGSIGNLMGRIFKIKYRHNKKNKKRHNEIESIQVKSKWPIRIGDVLEVWTKKGNVKLNVDSIDLIDKASDRYHYNIDTLGEKDFSLKDRIFKAFDNKLDEEAKSTFIGAKTYTEDLKIDKENKLKKILKSGKIDDYLEEYYRTDNDPNLKISNTGKPVRHTTGKLSITVTVYNQDQLRNILRPGLFNIICCYPGQILDGRSIKSSIDIESYEKKTGKNIIIDTPHIIYDKEFEDITEGIKRFLKKDISSFRVLNSGILEILREIRFDSKTKKIFLGSSFNTSNILSMEFFTGLLDNKKTDIFGLEFSPELNISEIGRIIKNFNILHKDRKNFLFSVFAHGYHKVMTARYDILNYHKKLGKKGIGAFIEDQKGYKFLMDSGDSSNTMIYNSKKICMVFDLDKIVDSGINNIIIDGKFTETDELLKIADSYHKAISVLFKNGKEKYREYVHQLDNIKSFKDYSRGHLFRGVD
ncbi:U32 family peptidase [Actinomycetota bacterium]